VSRAGDRPQGKRSDWDRETTQHRAKTEARICFSQADYVEKVIAAAKALEAQIVGLREVGELLRRQLDDVREDRDRWRGQAERLVLTRPPPSRSWWRRLAG
jgi:hypothetical protein